MLIVIELFGSPMMKNCNVIIALLFGYFVAGVSEKCVGSNCYKFVTDDKIENAEASPSSGSRRSSSVSTAPRCSLCSSASS